MHAHTSIVFMHMPSLQLLTPHSRLHPTHPRSTPAQDLFFTNFISCSDIKASLHRAFQVGHLPNPALHSLTLTLTRSPYALAPAPQDDTHHGPCPLKCGQDDSSTYTYDA